MYDISKRKRKKVKLTLDRSKLRDQFPDVLVSVLVLLFCTHLKKNSATRLLSFTLLRMIDLFSVKIEMKVKKTTARTD